MVIHLHFCRLVVDDLVATLNLIAELNFLGVLALPILDLELRVPRDLLWFHLAGIVVSDVQTEIKLSNKHIFKAFSPERAEIFGNLAVVYYVSYPPLAI